MSRVEKDACKTKTRSEKISTFFNEAYGKWDETKEQSEKSPHRMNIKVSMLELRSGHLKGCQTDAMPLHKPNSK